jgi:aminoglycoside 3'-phosphotransferase II
VNARSELSLLLPDWQRELSRVRVEPVESGLGGAALFRIAHDDAPSRYLKIGQDKVAAALRHEIERTAWLAQRGVRVPAILRVDDRPEQVAVLMEAVPGVSADAISLPAPRLVDSLARALAALHALPLADCPFDESLAVRLARAAAVVAADEVDVDAFEPRNRGIAPAALLAGLMADQPAEDIVVVHGDATLSNIIVDNGFVGFVDCGNAGRGDRYLDLAILTADIEGHYGPQAAARFAQAYGQRAWDDRKARFYLDLYELF